MPSVKILCPTGHLSFTPLEKGSEAAFFIDFAFKSPLLSAVANVAFGYVASRMTESFIARAEDLYGAHIA